MTNAFIVWGYDDKGNKVYYPSSKSKDVDYHNPTHAKLNPNFRSAKSSAEWMWTEEVFIEEVEVNVTLSGNIIKVRG